MAAGPGRAVRGVAHVSERVAARKSGLHGLAIRLARAINRVLGRRGQVFGDRYHSRTLSTPRGPERAGVRAAELAEARAGQRWAATFDGWTVGVAPFARARTWLLRCGWRRHGLLDPRERPG
jgi:putative transposase